MPHLLYVQGIIYVTHFSVNCPPHPDESRINRALIEAVRLLPNVTVHELIRAYPDYRIDVAREQALLESHDAVVMMFPFFWYSSPAILREWQDAVLTYGFAYGSEGANCTASRCSWW